MQWKVKFHITFTHDSGIQSFVGEKLFFRMLVDGETEEEVQNIILEKYEDSSQSIARFLLPPPSNATVVNENLAHDYFCGWYDHGVSDNEELEFDSCERLNSTE